MYNRGPCHAPGSPGGALRPRGIRVSRAWSWLPAFSLCAFALIVSPGPAPADSGPVALEDSTSLETFRLANGLRVVTRHVPGCRNVDVTVAYDYGRADEPKGKEGFATLLAELQFYGETETAPERTRQEMPSLLPAGWDLAVGPRVTRFSEIGNEQLLPGLIHQAAARMRGVKLTQTTLKRAVADVRADLDSACRLNVGMALYHGARKWSEGDGTALDRMALARGIQSVNAREVQQQLSAVFVPANAVLAVAGNLRKIPLRALIESEFGSIPGGSPLKRAQIARLDSTTRVVPRAEVSQPAGVIGLIAPALDDTTHPGFFMELALVGAHCTKSWGPPEPGLTTRFHYSLFDDPDLARFYPPVRPGENDPELMRLSFVNTLNDLSARQVTPASYMALWRGLNWLLGGPMPTEIFERVLREPGALHTLTMSTAVRELWGGEPFWSQYRRRFIYTVGTPYTQWYARMLARRYMVDVLFVPKK
jgi:peptidase M16-like protein